MTRAKTSKQQNIASLEAKNGKAFQPGRSAILYFDFKDFKGDAKQLTNIFEYVPPGQNDKQLYLTMKIFRK